MSKPLKVRSLTGEGSEHVEAALPTAESVARRELMAQTKAQLVSRVLADEQRISSLVALLGLAKSEGGLHGKKADTLESVRLKQNWQFFERALESARQQVRGLEARALAGSMLVPIAYRQGLAGRRQPGDPSAPTRGKLQQISRALDGVRQALHHSRPFLGHSIYSRCESANRADAMPD